MIDIRDNFLTAEEIGEVRAFTLNNLVSDRPKYSGGYISIRLEELSIWSELQETVKERVEYLQNTNFFQGWIFVYDEECGGVTPHADPSLYNVNVWVTPDMAIEDSEKNGLLIANVKAPEEWEWHDYNRDLPKITKFLEDESVSFELVPYKYNRATIFEGKRFHKTAGVHTKPGIQNKRVNMTLMYK